MLTSRARKGKSKTAEIADLQEAYHDKITKIGNLQDADKIANIANLQDAYRDKIVLSTNLQDADKTESISDLQSGTLKNLKNKSIC